MTSSPIIPDVSAISLIGAGGHARVVASSAGRAGLDVKAVYETDPDLVGQPFGAVVVEADAGQTDGASHVAIGSNRARKAVVEARPGARWISVIDPSAILADNVDVQAGALIGLGARVQAGARIGHHAIVNTGAIVEHDSVVGGFAHIAPGAVLTGDVRIGEGALIGAGAVVLPGLSIGDWAAVGAGSVVTRSVGPGETVAGSPARPVPNAPE
ncbi:N/A [soil metagenome]